MSSSRYKTSETETKHSPHGEGMDDLKIGYIEALRLIERLHRRLLDVIKDELDRSGESEINAVQALLIFNISDAELTAGELKSRGYYQGSNVSYNLKKLVEGGYVSHERSSADKRSVKISLTEKGHAVRDRVEYLYNRQLKSVQEVAGLKADDFSQLNKNLGRLERFWTDQILYRL